MGGIISSNTVISENVQLRKLTGLESITDYDPFWNSLFSFNLKVDESELPNFNESIDDLLQALMYNTQTTGNFSALIRVFLRRSTELPASEQCANKIFLWQTANSLIILRYILKFLTERMNENEFVKVFGVSQEAATGESSDDSDSEGDGHKPKETKSCAEQFVLALVETISYLPVTEFTNDIHVEAVKCLITMLSCQLYSDQVSISSAVFGYFVDGECSNSIAPLSKALLNNYLHHNTNPVVAKKEPESIVLGIATSIWSMVQFAAGLEDGGDKIEDEADITLGSLSILLLLNLACHHPVKASNPFKETLANFQNAQEVSSLSGNGTSFKLSYNALYEMFCSTVNQEPPMLLLYIMLYRNSGFRNFVLSRINLENLILPVLHILHEGATSNVASNYHHTYLSLIITLILSEDDYFCKIIHETTVKSVDWLENDIALKEISLGGLTAFVFIRTIQKNALKKRDRYLHANCLAALANMSPSFKNLVSTVCQKMMALLEFLTKRHAKMVEHMRVTHELDVTQENTVNFHEDITYLEEGIRTLLEIINSTLTSSLRYNSHLVYTILYHRHLFDAFKQHPMFQDLLTNIATVISHFSSKVVNVKAGDGVAMMEIIEKEVVVWPTDRLTKFPELKYRYVEDDNTIDFFVPYIWRLSLQHSSINFDPSRIKLFNALSVTSTPTATP